MKSAHTTAPKIPTQISASRSVDDRSVLVRSTDAKPDAAYGLNERISLLAVDLAPDTSDIDIDDVGRRVKMQIPYMLQQHRPRHNMTFVANQILQNLKFPRQQVDVPAAAAHGSRYEVEFKIADAQHRVLDDGGAAASQCLHTRQ